MKPLFSITYPRDELGETTWQVIKGLKDRLSAIDQLFMTRYTVVVEAYGQWNHPGPPVGPFRRPYETPYALPVNVIMVLKGRRYLYLEVPQGGMIKVASHEEEDFDDPGRGLDWLKLTVYIY